MECDHADLIAQQALIGREPFDGAPGRIFYLETCPACEESVRFSDSA